MTYKDQFVVEVKCNGKFLRVQDDVVRLPFGSEYSLFLKNLSSRKASVKMSIDGEDVLDYSSLILMPNSSTELEGFLRGTTAKNRFKFIQKTKEIQDHRGDKADDGIIRVEFAFEKPLPEIKRTIIHEDHEHHHHHHHHEWPCFHWNYNNWFTGDSEVKYGSSCENLSSRSISGGNQSSAFASNSTPVSNMVQVDSLGVESLGQPLSDEGITVKGSECNQNFRYASIGQLEQSEVIVIRLRGLTETTKSYVQEPVTTRTKLKCPTCGKHSKSSFKFCPNCGTYLE